MVLNDSKWLDRISKIDFAFQPIVNIHTGVCYGYEALLRNYKDAGFETIDSFFNEAYCDKMLHNIDMTLRRKAIEKFSLLVNEQPAKLFFNLDSRILESGDYEFGNTSKILEQHQLPKDTICFELSEKYEFANPREVAKVLKTYRSQGFNIAMDDYGVGFSGFQMLYYAEPEFIKIDRFFIQDIEKDTKKRLFVSNIVNIAHLLGIVVIAEGVETESEYFISRDLGCDLVQGYLIQRPQTDIGNLIFYYEHIHLLNKRDKRKASKDQWLISAEMEHIEPIPQSNDALSVCEKFREQKNNTFFPVVNSNDEPIGIIRENSFKDYTYSKFGRELLRNPAFGKDLSRFVTKFPVADVHIPVEKILEIYSQYANAIEGIIIVEDMKYAGFLSAPALLKILNEKNLSAARDQNPLTKLPGNTRIYEYISQALQNRDDHYFLIYFDFDHFKPYNDKYGFRNGDRVILYFADILKHYAATLNRFSGHIGGDDFFMGIHNEDFGNVYAEMLQLAERFKKDVESFYDRDAISNGFTVSTDRDGKIRRFDLLSVSIVILEIPANRQRIYLTEEISKCLATLKSMAKKSVDHVYRTNIYHLDELLSQQLLPNQQHVVGSLNGLGALNNFTPIKSVAALNNIISLNKFDNKDLCKCALSVG
ncbi:MAG: GGDEF domain-containing protein [Desulfamplus sp.]|nr:GGDEF domain-containing protein [Desulfamplus sp.]